MRIGKVLHLKQCELDELLKDPDKRVLSDVPRGLDMQIYNPPAREQGNKLGAKRVRAEGYKFDSQLEYKRYLVLREQEKLGIISNLDCNHKLEKNRTPEMILAHRWILQEPYMHLGKRVKSITYTDDFQYILVATGERILEDIKGWPTPAFKRSLKMFNKRYPDVVLFVNYKVNAIYTPELSLS